MKKSRKVAVIGLLTALCLVLSYIEFLLPIAPLGIPGIKIGLANICVIFALYRFGLPEAAGINLMRIVLCWLIFGNFLSLLYSLAGAFLSIITMTLLKSTKKFTPLGVSAAGGASHNLAQLSVAAVFTDVGAVWYYFPVLLISGTVAGAVNGFILKILLKRTDIR